MRLASGFDLDFWTLCFLRWIDAFKVIAKTSRCHFQLSAASSQLIPKCIYQSEIEFVLWGLLGFKRGLRNVIASTIQFRQLKKMREREKEREQGKEWVIEYLTLRPFRPLKSFSLISEILLFCKSRRMVSSGIFSGTLFKPERHKTTSSEKNDTDEIGYELIWAFMARIYFEIKSAVDIWILVQHQHNTPRYEQKNNIWRV